MNTAATLLHGPVTVCECCHWVRESGGAWTPRHVSWAPPPHRTTWDICDECCDRYVQCLLGPARFDGNGDPVLPRFRHRGVL